MTNANLFIGARRWGWCLAAVLAVAGCSEDSDTGEAEGADGTSGTTTGSTTEATTTSSSTTSAGSGDADSETTEGSTDTTEGGGTDSTGSTTDGGTGGSSGGEMFTCDGAAAHARECGDLVGFGEQAEMAASELCNDLLSCAMDEGPECEQAAQDLGSCLEEVPCLQLASLAQPGAELTACPDEQAAVSEACGSTCDPFGGGGGSGSTGGGSGSTSG